jgi:hypothetical protein
MAFPWGGAGLLTAALLCAVIFVNAKKEDVPTEAPWRPPTGWLETGKRQPQQRQKGCPAGSA